MAEIPGAPLPRSIQQARAQKEFQQSREGRRQAELQAQAIRTQQEQAELIQSQQIALQRQQQLIERYNQGKASEQEFQQLTGNYSSEQELLTAYSNYLTSFGQSIPNSIIRRFPEHGVSYTAFGRRSTNAAASIVSSRPEALIIGGSPVVGGYSSIGGESVFITSSGNSFVQSPASFERFYSPVSLNERVSLNVPSNPITTDFLVGSPAGAQFTQVRESIPSIQNQFSELQAVPEMKQSIPTLFDVNAGIENVKNFLAPEIDIGKFAGQEKKIRVIIPGLGLGEYAVLGAASFFSGGVKPRAQFEYFTVARRRGASIDTAIFGSELFGGALDLEAISIAQFGSTFFNKTFFRPQKINLKLDTFQRQVSGEAGTGRGELVPIKPSSGLLSIQRFPSNFEIELPFSGRVVKPFKGFGEMRLPISGSKVKAFFVEKIPIEVETNFSSRLISQTVPLRGEINPLLERGRISIAERELGLPRLGEAPVSISGGIESRAIAKGEQDIIRSQLEQEFFHVNQINKIVLKQQRGFGGYDIVIQEPRVSGVGSTGIQSTIRLAGFELGEEIPLSSELLVSKQRLGLRAGNIYSSIGEGKFIGKEKKIPIILESGSRRVLLENRELIGNYSQSGFKIKIEGGKRTGFELVKAKSTMLGEMELEGYKVPLRVFERSQIIGSRGSIIDMAQERRLQRISIKEKVDFRRALKEQRFAPRLLQNTLEERGLIPKKSVFPIRPSFLDVVPNPSGAIQILRETVPVKTISKKVFAPITRINNLAIQEIVLSQKPLSTSKVFLVGGGRLPALTETNQFFVSRSRFQEKFAPRTNLLSRPSSRFKNQLKQRVFIRPITSSISKLINSPISKPVTKPVSKPVSIPLRIPITFPITTPQIIPATIPLTVPVTTPITVPTTIPITAPITIPLTVPVTTPIKVPPYSLQIIHKLKAFPGIHKAIQERFLPGYFVQLFRKGKPFRTIKSPALTREQAIALGSQSVDTSILRSFKIIPANTPATITNYYSRQQILRPGKRNPSLFVERSKYAISTRGEKRTLYFARKGLRRLL